MCKRLTINLDISPQQLIHYYQGTVSTVVTYTTNGQTIHLPANILRSLVQANGIHGIFELVVDKNHKFISIKRIKT